MIIIMLDDKLFWHSHGQLLISYAKIQVRTSREVKLLVSTNSYSIISHYSKTQTLNYA